MSKILTSPQATKVANDVAGYFGKKAVIEWLHEAYNAHYGSTLGSSPEALRAEFNSRGYLRLSEMRELVRWKLTSRWVSLFVEANSYHRIRNTTAKVARHINSCSPEAALNIVLDIRQIGIATSSAVLAAWSPDFPIIDARAWNKLYQISGLPYFGPTSTKSPNQVFKPGNYESYVQIVRKAASALSVAARDLEIALYMTGHLNGR